MVDSWLDTAPSTRLRLQFLFEKYVDALLDVIRINKTRDGWFAVGSRVQRFLQVSTLVTLLKGILKPSEEANEQLRRGTTSAFSSTAARGPGCLLE